MIGLHLLRKGAIRCPRDRHALDGRDRVIIWKKKQRHRRNEIKTYIYSLIEGNLMGGIG